MSFVKDLLRYVVFLPLHPRALHPILLIARKTGMLPVLAPSAGNTRRILVVNLTTYLGDGVMMMPFLQSLREVTPAAEIELVTTAAIAPVFEPLPLLNRVYCLPRPASRLPIWSTYLRMLQMLRLVRSMPHGMGFDTCFLPRWGTDPGMSAWLALFAGIPDIRGYDPREDPYGGSTIPGASFILTSTATGGQSLPEALRELRLLEVTNTSQAFDYPRERLKQIKALRFLSGTVDEKSLLQRLGCNPATPFFALCPGASSQNRRWPAERFAQLASELYGLYRIPSYLLGGPADAQIGQVIQRNASSSAINLCGKTSLPEVIALLAKAIMLIANDSGPAHVGAGLGTPTVVLSACPEGSTVEHAGSPSRVAPVGPSVRVLQPYRADIACEQNCAHDEPHCILGLSVEAVFNAARELLAGTGSQVAAVSR